MRTFDSALVDLAARPSREFSILATFRDRSIKFNQTFDSDDTDSDFPSIIERVDLSTSASESSETGGVYRVAKDGTTNELWYALDSVRDADWGTTTWNKYWGPDSDNAWVCDSDVSPLIGYNGGVYFVDTDGALRLGSATSDTDPFVVVPNLVDYLGATSSKMTFATNTPGGNRLYILTGPDTDNAQEIFMIEHDTTPGRTYPVQWDKFPGKIYQDSDASRQRLGIYTDEQIPEDLEYLYFMERGRLSFLTFGESQSGGLSGGTWGSIEPVIPLEVIDVDWSSFELGGVCRMRYPYIDLDHSVGIISGRLKRGDLEWDVFISGYRGRHTVDRWSLITSDITMLADPGEIIFTPLDSDRVQHLIYTGPGAHMLANPTGRYFTDLDTDLDTDDILYQADIVNDLNFSARSNAPSTMSISIGEQYDTYSAYIQRGYTVSIDVGWADSDGAFAYDRFGVFATEVISPVEDEAGAVVGVGGRGWGSSRMDLWESDQSYEYWSQTKMYTNPASRLHTHHNIGQWKTDSDDSYLYMDELNKLGFLYSVFKSARNSLVQARFNVDSDESGYFTARRGVGVNYFRQAVQYAADARDILSEDVEDTDWGDNAIVAVYSEGEVDTDNNLGLYFVRHSEWTLLESAPYTIADATNHWISIQFDEGFITVRMRYDSDEEWDTVIEHRYSGSFSPWYKEETRAGRGVSFLENDTPSEITPGFSSTAEIIPVENGETFPFNGGQVRVDDELIVYNRAYTDTDHSLLNDQASGFDTDWWDSDETEARMLVFPGVTYDGADHDAGGYWSEGKLLWQGDLELLQDGNFVKIGYDETYVVHAAQAWFAPNFAFVPYSVKIGVQKVGTPPTGLWVHYLHDDWDNQGSPYFGGTTVIAHKEIVDSDVPDPSDSDFPEDDMTLIEFVLDFDTDSYPGGMPTRGDDNDWISVTSMPPRSTDYGSYHDSDNYWIVAIQEGTLTNSLGIQRNWGSGPGWFYGYEDTDFPDDDGGSPLEDIQIINEIWGFSVHAEGYEVYVYGHQSGGREPIWRDNFDHMALVVVDGPGKGSVFEITDYDYDAPHQWVPDQSIMGDSDEFKQHIGDLSYGSWVDYGAARFGVKNDPRGILVADQSYVRVYETLGGELTAFYEWEEIERGATSWYSDSEQTSPAAHSAGSLVSIWDPGKVRIDRMKYHSGGMDYSLESISAEIAAKAGVFRFDSELTTDSNDTDALLDSDTPSGFRFSNFFDNKTNLIMKSDFHAVAIGKGDSRREGGLLFRADTDNASSGFVITLAGDYAAVQFNSSVGYIHKGDSDDVLDTDIAALDISGDVTFDFWMRTVDRHPWNETVLHLDGGFRISYFDSNNYYEFGRWDSDGNETVWRVNIDSLGLLDIFGTRWIHNAIVYSQDDGKAYFWFNGLQHTDYDTDPTDTDNLNAATGAFKIGSDITDSDWGDFRFADMRISNVARYTNGTNFSPPRTRAEVDSDTVALWPADEGTGVIVADSGPNALDLRFHSTNTPAWAASDPFLWKKLKFYKWIDADSDYTLQEQVDIRHELDVGMTISIQEEHFSVWDHGGSLLYTFTDTDYLDNEYVAMAGWDADSDSGFQVNNNLHWSTVDKLVDAFIFDMGSRGTQLLQGVIGRTDHRMFWKDTADGGIYVGRIKTRIEDSDDYDFGLDTDIVIKESERLTDMDQRTFIRSEGAGRETAIFSAEVADFDEMEDKGYLFSYHNAPLAFSEWETEREAEFALDDRISSSHVISFNATLDPRIEPNDVLAIEIPTTSVIRVVVDSINFTARSGESEASIDMGVQARVALYDDAPVVPFSILSSEVVFNGDLSPIGGGPSYTYDLDTDYESSGNPMIVVVNASISSTGGVVGVLFDSDPMTEVEKIEATATTAGIWYLGAPTAGRKNLHLDASNFGGAVTAKVRVHVLELSHTATFGITNSNETLSDTDYEVVLAGTTAGSICICAASVTNDTDDSVVITGHGTLIDTMQDLSITTPVYNALSMQEPGDGATITFHLEWDDTSICTLAAAEFIQT
jgi:hypothetical protein